jgi:two-component system sensor histidine kinase KdpD
MPSADKRPDPDALLASIMASGTHERGHLKIFLGAAPGVGKTFDMLTAAHEARRKGSDVVAGFIETHGRQGTAAQIGELEMLPRLAVPYRGKVLEEFDLEAALARKAQLLLVDELAHTNAPGLRHAKRWQDVKALLDAGLNVWTTLNVQHLESLNDQIARITGVRVTETLPDTVLDLADEIEFIDIPPTELRTRLAEGQIYRPDIAARALEGFFREGNLGALREIALRRAAQRIDRDVTLYMQKSAIPGPWPVAEKVLALAGADAAASNVVRHAARLAEALHAPLTVLHIEQGETPPGLQAALDLAAQLGASVLTQDSPDLIAAVLSHAAANNVTHIVLGRTSAQLRFGRRRLHQRLAEQAGAYTLHLIPVPAALPARAKPLRRAAAWEPYAVAGALLGLTTLLGLAATAYVPREAMGMIFTGLIVLTASRSGPWPGLFTALIAFLSWNFFFLPPVHTFSVNDPRDIAALVVFLVVGLLTGQLSGRVRAEAAAAGTRVEALRRISAIGQRFSRAATLTDVLRGAAEEAAAMTQGGAVLLHGPRGLALEATSPPGLVLSASARAAAEWCFGHDTETGLGTSTLPGCPWRFLPLRASGQVIGVLGAKPQAPPPAPLAQTLATLAGQAALAAERARLATSTARAEARQDSQKLRNALLSSLSHDLRTPLTAIRGAAETLDQAGTALDAPTRADLLSSIIEETARMGKFLANIMDMARVQAGTLTPKAERLMVAELVEAAIGRVPGTAYSAVRIAPDAAQLIADPTLLEQVLVNLLDNAVKYAPQGSQIQITATRAGAMVRLGIADAGVGIPADELNAVFDSFFRASRGDRVAPGTGLGLAIAKAFTEAMGGRISAQSPRPDLPADGLPGTVISVELPAA